MKEIDQVVKRVEEKLGRKRVDKIIVILIFILIGAIGYNVFLMTTEGSKCINNPLVYGAGRLGEANQEATLMCSCSIIKDKSSATLTFDKEKSELKINGLPNNWEGDFELEK